MYIKQVVTKNGSKTKFRKWVNNHSVWQQRCVPKRDITRETLTQTRARNAREYKWYFGKVMTYPGFGRGHTYLGAHKVFY